MYSGTGKAIFDFIEHCRDDFEFSVLMDTLGDRNFDLTAEFCRNHGLTLTPSEPLLLAGCIDSGIAAAAAHITCGNYDVIECVSWANASTNLSVLDSCPATTRLIFTPHTQPQWTLGDQSYRYFMIGPVFQRMLSEVDAVFADSAAEAQMPEFSGCDPRKLHVLALGVNTKRFQPKTVHNAGEILCVCDTREPRKRVDLLMEAFAHSLEREPDLRLTLAGQGSDTWPVPGALDHAVRRMGYITDEQLIELYQSSSLFVLFSDFEAFGLPIAEALCCGLPTLLNRKGVPADLFADMPGVHWIDNRDPKTSGLLMAELALQSPDPDIAAEAVRRFGWEGTYGRKRDIALSLVGH